ncbi:Auxin-induced in root cultures protein 12 [Apostasia shenzhenica]|uniref:Cytochrome b561 and DOMON domain-containing protein n=1 Tax=Apostasia shenzhenica TaxID=1088818 RepID=A0A2H9ZZA2_9ASPA|nr:Auxin-induced in root cultures protein 12 [Apostasia shenzhenica]
MAILQFRLLFIFLFSLFRSSLSQSCSSPAIISSNHAAFTACSELQTLSSSLRWTFDAATSSLSFAFSAPPASGAGEDGWIAWAINPSGDGMLGSQSLIAYRQSDGKIGVKTFNISDYAIKPSPIDFPTADLAAEFVGGVMRIFGNLFLPKGVTHVNQVWQVGAAVKNGIPGKHDLTPENMNAKGKLALISGQSTAAGDSTYRNRNIHGILNAVSWGILLPIGATIARYLKTFRSADPAWFYLHVSCQVIGYSAGVAGWATGLNLGSKSKGIRFATHRNIGITLFALGTLQIFALFLRPRKDHKLRFSWNVYHHSVGYTVVVLGIINVFRGLRILSPGDGWKLAYVFFLCALGAAALLLEAITWLIVLRRKKTEASAKLNNGARPPLE